MGFKWPLAKVGEYVDGQLNGWSTQYESSGAKEEWYYINGEIKSYVQYTPEGSITQSEVLIHKDELPPFSKEYIHLLSKIRFSRHCGVPFTFDVPGYRT